MPRFDIPVTVVVGGDPWDFSLAYALHRLSGAAWWAPPEFTDDQLWWHELMALARNRPSRTLSVTSVSDMGAARTFASSVAKTLPGGVQPSVAEPEELIPVAPQRLMCAEGVNRRWRLRDDGDGLVPSDTPLPVVRPRQGGMWTTTLSWIAEIKVDGWSVIEDSRLGTVVLTAPGYDSHFCRTTADGVAYVCPQPFRQSNVDLEALVPRPLVQVAGAQAQVTAIAAAGGYIAAPSDKGVYTQRSAALFGDLKPFVDVVSSPAWQSFLAAATRPKGGPPGRFDRTDKRRYFLLSDLDRLLASAGLSQSPAGLVRRRILLRGLSHTCDVCRWTGWFPQEELGEVLRCGRCRKRITLDDEGWHSDGEPLWVYRLNELLWQFAEHHSDLPLRAGARYLMPTNDEVPWDIGVETDVFAGDKRIGETDILFVRGGELWVGEAKAGDLPSANKWKPQLRRLERVARALRADGVLIASEAELTDDQRELARDMFPGPWPALRVETM